MQLRGGFQLVVLSGKTPGRVLNFKKNPWEGFIQGRVFPTATLVFRLMCLSHLDYPTGKKG